MTAADIARARDIRAIHAMKREVALTDDSYREIIARVTVGRVDSSADMTATERGKLLDELRRLGGGKRSGGAKPPPQPLPRGGRGACGEARPFKPAKTKQQEMIRGQWLELAEIGEILDASEAALAAYILRQAKVESLQWVSSDKAQSVIGGLRGWLKRAKKQRGISP
jgi:phage gp16-like protein